MQNLPKNVVRGADGKPLKLYHGTTKNFVIFNMSKSDSLGCHFGDQDQANYFTEHDVNRTKIDSSGGRVFPVYLICNQLLDVSGDDLGWRWPKPTAWGLFHRGFITRLEAEEFVDTGLSMIEVANARYANGEVGELNAKLLKLITKKGFDTVKYTNDNEPHDGKGRDAYFLTSTPQIIFAIGLSQNEG